MTTPLRALGIASLCFIWGSTWLAIKIGLEDLPPFLAAGSRFAVAATLLAVLSWARGLPFPRGARFHLGLLGLGLTAFLASYGAVYWGEQYIPSGLSAVLFATYPLVTLLVAHLAIRAERITARRAAGMVLAFVGVALLFRSDLALDHPRGVLGAAVTLASPVAASLGSVGVKKWGQDVHPYTLTTLPMGYGAVGLLALSLAFEEPGAARWTPLAVGTVAYLALLGSVVAFVVYYRVLKEVAVSSLAMISYVFPVVAVALGWLVLGERLDGWAAAGIGLVVAGIATATARRRRAPATGAGEPGAMGGEATA